MNWLFSTTNKKNIRVKATPGKADETYVTVGLTNSFDFLQVLSLKLTQSEVYRLFDSTYGMVAGRVIGNESLGIPNCRVSIFIPKEIDGTEAQSPLENVHKLLVAQHYPYESVSDADGDGRRYNLLTNQSKNRGFNGFPENELNIGYTPKTPVGSFPEKEELLANDFFLTAYEKYYKYSTVTNESGDYMLFGVPVGTHTIHMDCDLTDIGRWSIAPVIMSRVLGYPNELFGENGTKILPTTDLDRLPNIQSQNLSVNVRPFWSQHIDKKEVGVTRQDFKIAVPIVPSFTIFGSNFTMARNRWWGDNVFFRLHYGWKNLCFKLGYDCSDGDSCDTKVSFYAGIKIDLGFTDFNKSFTVNCDHKPSGYGIFFGLSIQLANKVPFLAFEFGDNFCRLEGGKYDSNSFDIINHGDTCRCKTQDALLEIPDSGITDALLLNNHRTDNANIQVFSLKKSITDAEADTLNALIQANTTNAPITSDALLNRVDETTDIEVLGEGRYAALIEPGQFALQIPTNRRPMITDEEGNLVDSPDPAHGVFTEFRGYLYVTTDGDFDSPEGKYTVGRVAMKIPQSFDYSASNSSDSSGVRISRRLTRFKEWIFNHGVFKAGEIYSVAQKLAIKNSDFSDSEEEGNHTFNGGGTDAKLGDPLDPNYETSGSGDNDIGWDTQTGLLLFTKDADLTLTPALGWEEGTGSVIGISLNYTGYPKVIDYIPPTHLTRIGKENSYSGVAGSTNNHGGGASENAPNTDNKGELSSTGSIDETIAPTTSTQTFNDTGYVSEPRTSGVLAPYSGSNPFPYYFNNRGMIAQTWTAAGDITRFAAAATVPQPRGTQIASIVRFHPWYSALPGDLLEQSDGAVNWKLFTNNGQRNLEYKYYISVDVLFLDTMHVYSITSQYAVYGTAQGVFKWNVQVPQAELAADPTRTEFRVRLKYTFTWNGGVYYWTPEFKLT
jgi:hypothetical protein